jgi:hypothetical protein
MTGLCLAVGALTAKLAISSFTLAWTHSVEKQAWQEDYRVTAAGLVLDEARIKGSGAGMDPPQGAVLRGGWWHYRPNLPPLPRLILARSHAVADWRLCVAGSCRPLGTYLPDADGETESETPAALYPCAGPK